MSRFEVDLTQPETKNAPAGVQAKPFLSDQTAPQKTGMFGRILKIFGILLLLFVIVGAAGAFIYWQSLKNSPQYSLALLVDAARRDDQAAIDELVDTDAIVDDFLPQITDKAVELYGRGLPKERIGQIARVVAPVLPAIKQRAREELPGLIREKTAKFENIPFWAIAVGARQYMDISEEGDTAFIKSKLPGRPLELTMRRSGGGRWRVVAVKDDVLAERIAQKVGQGIIALVQKNGTDSLKDAGKKIGIENLQDIFNQAQDILNR